jgi:hypothetical protein
MGMEIRDFETHQRIRIHADSDQQASRLFGKAMREGSLQLLDNHSLGSERGRLFRLAGRMYDRAKVMSHGDMWVIGGVNWLARYLERLENFCIGAQIPLERGVSLQVEAESGCQTVLVRFAPTNTVLFLHTEENADDPALKQFYSRSDLQANYKYRIVDYKVGTRHMTFFAYPGLCWGGPAFAYDHSLRFFSAVDALYTIANQGDGRYDIWKNAMTSILLDMPSTGLRLKLLLRLRKFGIRIYGGYAMHFAAPSDTQPLSSYEFGAGVIRTVAPNRYGDRTYVAQGNYPRSKAMLAIDALLPGNLVSRPAPRLFMMISLFMRRRAVVLRNVARSLQSGDHEAMKTLARTLADSRGDLYRERDGRRTYTGFVNTDLAGYGYGVLDQATGDTMVFGKYSPPSLPGRPYRYYFDPEDPIAVSYGGMELWRASYMNLKRMRKGKTA